MCMRRWRSSRIECSRIGPNPVIGYTGILDPVCVSAERSPVEIVDHIALQHNLHGNRSAIFLALRMVFRENETTQIPLVGLRKGVSAVVRRIAM